MTGRSKVGWHVPTDEWDKFVEHAADEHGQIDGYVGREVERAMREWVDADAYAPVEALVDDLVEAAGRTPANLSQKNPRRPHPRRAATRQKFNPVSTPTSAAEPRGSTSEETVDDGADAREEIEAETTDRMDLITSATPATDGGEPVNGEP